MELENKLPTMRDRVDALEQTMLSVPQLPLPVKEYFAPGMYAREISIPKGAVLIGAIHKTQNLAVLSAGRLELVTESGTVEIAAPHILTVMPGTKNAAFALEYSVWTNFFPTTETDTAKLAELLTESTLDEMVGGCNNKQAITLLENERKDILWHGQ